MPPRSYTFNPPTNPVLQVLYFIVGGVVLIGAVLMGAVILAIALGVAIVFGLVVYARVWWLRRKLRKAAQDRQDGRGGRGGPGGRAGRGGRGSDDAVLEVEYVVVEERDERERRD